MALDLHIVDAFTSEPFKGNPAAVCLLNEDKAKDWMQGVAAEMNLSETAFLLREAESWRLRWFTPKIEVDLCGHATLASAHILWQTRRISKNRAAIFMTRSGQLTATKNEDWIEMDFPAEPAEKSIDAPELLAALNAAGCVIGRKENRMDYLIELTDARAVRSISPDFSLLGRLPVRGVIVTAKSDDPQFDFISRFFAPAAGINEDPVTGSAHCCLGPYWAQKLNKSNLIGFQASARGGIVRVGVRGNRVLLGGQAVTVFNGQMLAR